MHPLLSWFVSVLISLSWSVIRIACCLRDACSTLRWYRLRIKSIKSKILWNTSPILTKPKRKKILSSYKIRFERNSNNQTSVLEVSTVIHFHTIRIMNSLSAKKRTLIAYVINSTSWLRLKACFKSLSHNNRCTPVPAQISLHMDMWL